MAWGQELARVYVSSTIADLTEERRAVLDWLRLARHQAVDSYLPDSDTVRDSCLDDVAGCDLYVPALLPICERVHGPEHPSNVTVRDQLAYWTWQAEDRG